MSGLGYILRQGIPMATGTAIQAAAAFGANLVLARHLTPAEFGRFALVQAAAGLVIAVASLRLSAVVLRTPEERLTDEFRRRIATWMLLEALGVLGVLGCWAMVVGGLRPLDWVLALAVVFGHWLSENRAFYERQGRFHRLTALETGIQLTGHGGAMLLAAYGLGADILYLREVFLAAGSALGLIWLGGLRPFRPVLPRLSHITGLIGEIRGTWLDGVLESSFQRLTLMTVNAATSLAGTGLFFQAHRLALVPHQFVSPIIGRVLAVWVGGTESIAARRTTRNHILLLLGAVLVVAALGAVFLADPVIPWIFGSHWAPAAPVLRALAGMIVFLSLFETLRCFAVMTRRLRLLLLARLGQYAGFALPLMPLAWGGTVSVETLGLSLSAAYALAFLILLASFYYNELRA